MNCFLYVATVWSFNPIRAGSNRIESHIEVSEYFSNAIIGNNSYSTNENRTLTWFSVNFLSLLAAGQKKKKKKSGKNRVEGRAYANNNSTVANRKFGIVVSQLERDERRGGGTNTKRNETKFLSRVRFVHWIIKIAATPSRTGAAKSIFLV